MLIIDDDPAVVRMLEWIIEENELGQVIGRAHDGLSGAEAALTLRPDVVILDLLMPGQDGLRTVRHLQQQGFAGAHVMISQVTAKALVGKAYQSGVEYFIHKPLHVPEVQAVLRRVCETMRLRQAVQSIQASLAPLAAGSSGQTAAANRRADSGAEALHRRTRAVLADLGILGTAGGRDLCRLPCLPCFNALRRGPLELHQIYAALAEHQRDEPDAGRELGLRALEQRIRRAAGAALTHLAALGLEDYHDPRFERLAPVFFEFTQVRAEMARLRTGRGLPGRVNLKKFLEAFLQVLEETAD